MWEATVVSVSWSWSQASVQLHMGGELQLLALLGVFMDGAGVASFQGPTS